MNGKVYLVGAGPGDIGLLTVKGLRCLQKAEVVIYDFHLNAQILNYINHKAEFIYAGKRGGHHTMNQDEINAMLIKKAKEGSIICRLKGGDPFVFGRGGEEAEILSKKNIEFEIVPGVSSSIAAPAYAGIPLTHRLFSSSFAVIPGYEDITKEESAIKWSKLATGVGTLVFLMAVKNVASIAQKLIDNGLSPDTPVAIIRWGTRPDQKTIVGTLENIAGILKENEIKPPAVMVVGEVVKLRESLNWYEKKPMFGHRILVTREHLEGFEPLEELGAEILAFPTIEIVPPKNYIELDNAIDSIETYHWLIFTSRNGVKYFLGRFFEKDRDIRDLKGINICTIGNRTAREIEKYGLKVDLIPERFHAEGLIEAIIKMQTKKRKCKIQNPRLGSHPGGFAVENESPDETNSKILKGVRFLLPRAEIAREVFPETVRGLGGEIDVPVVYRTIKPDSHGKRLRRFLREGKITIATFTSASTFHNFKEIIGEDVEKLLKGVAIAAIGPVTAKAIEKTGLHVAIMPRESTIDEMVAEIMRWATVSCNRKIAKSE